MALDVADKAWRVTRSQQWEAAGYSRPDKNIELANQADMLLNNAADDRKSAAAMRNPTDSSIDSEDLWGAYCRLAFKFGSTEKQLDQLEDADTATRMKALESLVDKHFDSAEAAAELLESLAEEREAKANSLYAAVLPFVVRDELGRAFSRNAERLVTHTSRELDRSLQRYWRLWDRMHPAQPPTDASPPTEDGEDPPVSAPAVPLQPRPHRPSPHAAIGDPPSSDQASDLEAISDLLDRILEVTNVARDEEGSAQAK